MFGEGLRVGPEAESGRGEVMGASGVIGVRFLPKRVRKPMLSYRCPLAGGETGESPKTAKTSGLVELEASWRRAGNAMEA